MRKLTHALLVWSSFSVFVGCSADPESLGAKGDGQKNGETRCQGPDPSTLGCENGCPTGMVCDPDACHSSHCACDETTGHWACTADCAQNTCVPETPTPRCEGPNPALGCGSGCPTGTTCDRNACRPSTCDCDATTGGWICTDDCGPGGTCVPERPQPECRGPNPSLGCGSGCPSGTVCDRNACRPSSCSCDATTGGWACTFDCGSGGACVPDSGATCQGPNPSLGCDAGCPSGTVCDPNACRSSACSCDPQTGYWQCTADCGSGGACVPERRP